MNGSARRDLAIQTYCLRGFTDSRDVARKVAELGLALLDPALIRRRGAGFAQIDS